jgi:SecD/SecF fusion protein
LQACPLEGLVFVTNIHWRLFWFILLLLAGSIYVVSTRKPKLGLDIQGGMRVVLRAKTEELRSGKWTAENLETTAGIIRSRVDALGVAEPVIYTKPDNNQIVVELPGIRNKQDALNAIQTTAKLEFRYVEELEREWRFEDEEVNGVKTGFQVITGPNGPISPEELEARIFSKDPVLTGDQLEPNSRAELGPQGTVIHFEFKGPAKQDFESFTRSHIGKKLAIFLDKRLISAPVIEEPIPGVGIIRGSFTPEQARTLASQLNAGALPVPLELQQQESLEATLGRQAMHQTLIAGVIGLVLVLLFMAVYYKLPGLLADLALVLYTLFSYSVFVGGLSWLGFPGVTLTVPGIAGFILSIGMAVDANILIFERFKEEHASGKSMRAAIETGFKRAFTAIFDSNMCTLITCAILYHFGTGPVRGFAVTLAIGVLISMFTAITCSRTFLLILAGTRPGQNERLYPLQAGLHPKLNVTKHMALWFGVSGALIVPGLIFWLGLNGTRYSIEFTGGTEALVQFDRKPTVAQVDSVMRSAGFGETRVVLAEGNRAFVTTPRMTPQQQEQARAALEKAGGRVQSISSVSGAISRELKTNAIRAVALASILIVLYLAVRFAIGGFVEGLKFGVCAIGATLHDVLVIWGLFAIFGYTIGWQVDSLFVTALLTVIGFSTHDTIVIFDRIRENLRHKARGETFAEVTDRSIEQTFSRSVNTSLTVVLTLVALLIWGGPTVRVFVSALLLGVISGTYSSIFNASPLLVLWRRVSERQAAAAAAASGRAGQSPARQSKPAQAVTPAPTPAARPRPTQPARESGGALEGGTSTTSAAGASASSSGSSDKARTKRRKRRM